MCSEWGSNSPTEYGVFRRGGGCLLAVKRLQKVLLHGYASSLFDWLSYGLTKGHYSGLTGCLACADTGLPYFRES